LKSPIETEVGVLPVAKSVFAENDGCANPASNEKHTARKSDIKCFLYIIWPLSISKTKLVVIFFGSI
jgi:hypothetical protein